MFTKPLQCCFNDSLDSWQTYIAAVRTQNIEQDSLLLQFWPYDESGSGGIQDSEQVESTVNQDSETFPSLEECVEECVEEYLSTRHCVVGIRTRNHFMKSQLSAEVRNSYCEETYLIATPTRIINYRGFGAEDLTRKLLSRRCHQQNNSLDKLFYMCTDIGEVDADETEFLLAITPSDVSVISLYRGCISRSLPFTKIRTYQRNPIYPNTISLELGRMKHGNRTYSFRSERVGDFIIALRGQIEIISNLVEIRRKAVLSDQRETLSSERNFIIMNRPVSQNAVHSECIQADEFSQQSVSGSMSSQNRFEYESLGSTSSTGGSRYEYDSESTEFNSFPESVKYELPCDSSTENPEFSSHCSDIYPFVNNSFDSKEFCYERLGSESDRRASAPEPNVIYQDVDINLNRKYFARRRSRINSKPTQPTFVSYIEGGSEALEAVCRGRNRHSSEPGQSSTDFEGSGVYCKLFDPNLLNFASEQRASAGRNDAAYDILDRDFQPNQPGRAKL